MAAEYRQLCRVAGVEDMSASDVEKTVRELLQRTWDELAQAQKNIVDTGYAHAEEWDEMG